MNAQELIPGELVKIVTRDGVELEVMVSRVKNGRITVLMQIQPTRSWKNLKDNAFTLEMSRISSIERVYR